ncbi:MAG TPA: hypothetical protein VHT68_05950 [Pseudolabrys sp.]|jgi:hypothetical protein|nr:hypothetical protein [Pseudolabrys sp.]
MSCSRSLATALALAAPVFLLPASVRGSDRTLPMHFELRTQGPADACGTSCKVFVSAAGAITADTPRNFLVFAQGRDLAGATIAIDSDGGSVLGAIALGRAIRKLKLVTTVGRLVDSPADGQNDQRAVLSPNADCESMCAFVLLGGVQRLVPADARVMVHQIWLGDRREDPTAASYSAEDLVLVQRDIGRLAQYTAEMGASVDLLDLALRIPPWEPMHALTRDELKRTRLITDESDGPVAATVSASTSSAAPVSRPVPRMTNGLQAAAISEQRWALVDRSGVATLARRHPLTVEGEEIGSFDLVVACVAGGDSYDVSYIERRHSVEQKPLPNALDAVSLRVGGNSATLKVVSSERKSSPDELVTYASGRVPAGLIGAFGAVGSHSMLIRTQTAQLATGIRIGNTGATQNLPRLAAACNKPVGDRADLTRAKTGGLAAVK